MRCSGHVESALWRELGSEICAKKCTQKCNKYKQRTRGCETELQGYFNLVMTSKASTSNRRDSESLGKEFAIKQYFNVG